MTRLTKSFVTLADLYIAYKKAKVEAYYENTHSHALEFTAYEQNLHSNLNLLHERLTGQDDSWASELTFLGGFAYIPKSIDCSAWNIGVDGHFRALNPIEDWAQRYKESGVEANAKFRLVICPTVDFQIVSALWILKVGHLFDQVLDMKVSYGNRLRRERSENSESPINKEAIGLFVPYFSAYREWRERGLTQIEDSLRGGQNILALTMDIQRFYHRVSPSFLLKKKFLEAVNCVLSATERRFTQSLLMAIDTWYKSTPDCLVRPEGALPVGLSASKIISNVLLAQFDELVIEKIKPIYFGRYVDDIFLVFENDENLTTAKKVVEKIARDLAPLMKVHRDQFDLPSLKLKLPYAQDSELLFTGDKQKIFALSSSHGLDLIQHIREQIRVQSSEYRLLPEVPYTGVEMASRALLATPDSSLQVDALRKADVVSVRRLGFSLLLRDIEAYSADLSPDSWSELRNEFYKLVNNYVLTPTGFFEFISFIPRVYGLMLSCRDLTHAEQFVLDLNGVAELIRQTTSAGAKASQVQYKLCVSQYAQALLQAGLQAATDRTIELDNLYLRVLRKLKLLDPNLNIPSTLRRLEITVRQLLLADWGRRPYKDYWYFDQKEDELGPVVPASLQIRRILRLGAVRHFRSKLTDLKTPHWPALAFPTRPLRIDEIALVAPAVLNEPELFRLMIMVLRGAKVGTAEHLGITDDGSRSGVAKFSAPGKRKEIIRIAVTSVETTDGQWASAAKGKQDKSLARYRRITNLVNRILREKKRPDYIVFPELSIPRKWAVRIARKLAQNDVSLLAGVEYYRGRKPRKLRNDSLISLVTNWPGYRSNIAYFQPKFSPAHGERQELAKIKAGPLFEPDEIACIPTVFTHRGFCFSVLICSDLTNISHRNRLRGKIDALFALEWNKDTKTFSSLVEATSTDLHAFVVQANNRTYGDSRIRAPFNDEFRRDVVQVKGGVSDYHVLGEINYLGLRRSQRLSKSSKVFKPTPIGYKMSSYRKVNK